MTCFAFSNIHPDCSDYLTHRLMKVGNMFSVTIPDGDSGGLFSTSLQRLCGIVQADVIPRVFVGMTLAAVALNSKACTFTIFFITFFSCTIIGRGSRAL